MVMGYIFYLHSVVGGVVHNINGIYGARIHRTWRYNAFDDEYNWKIYTFFLIANIFYLKSVVGDNTYFINTKMGGGIHRTRRYVLRDAQWWIKLKI